MNYDDQDRIMNEFLDELHDFCDGLKSKEIKTIINVEKHISISQKDKLNSFGVTYIFDKIFKDKDINKHKIKIKKDMVYAKNHLIIGFDGIEAKQTESELYVSLKKHIKSFFDEKITNEQNKIKKSINNLDKLYAKDLKEFNKVN